MNIRKQSHPLSQPNHQNRNISDARLNALLQVFENRKISAGSGKTLEPCGMPSPMGTVGHCTVRGRQTGN